MPPDEAWDALKRAASAVGKVEEAHDATRSLVMKARYGLNPVRVRVAVISGGDGRLSLLLIQGRGQDVWGVASRKVIERLIGALSSPS